MTGLNAATVGIIALAAVQLSQKAIKDKLTRILVFLGASAGMLYNALWYFPVLMFVGGTATVIWDYRWIQSLVRGLKSKRKLTTGDSEANLDSVEMREVVSSTASGRRSTTRSAKVDLTPHGGNLEPLADDERRVPGSMELRAFSWQFGITIIACFFVAFIVIMILRGVLKNRPRGFSLFANLYLAGKRSGHDQFFG